MSERTGPEKSSPFLLLFFAIAAAFVVAVASGVPEFSLAASNKFTAIESPLH
jgi:hypothetical protein